jgi:type IV secretory pathway VirB4 component
MQLKRKQMPEISVQSSLPIRSVSQDGIILTTQGRYARIVEFGDIDYQLAKEEIQDDIDSRWRSILNHFDQSVSLELVCMNTPAEKANKGLVFQEAAEGGLDELKQEYTEMLVSRAAQATDGLVKKHFLVMSVKKPNAREARSVLGRLASGTTSRLRALGVAATVLNGSECVKLLARSLNTELNTRVNWSEVREGNIDLRDLIAPESLEFGHKAFFKVGNAYRSACMLQINASELTDNVLADILSLETPTTVVLHLSPMDIDEAKKFAASRTSDIDRMKIEEQKKAIRSGYDPDIIAPKLANFADEAHRINELLEEKDEHLFKGCVALYIEAPTKHELFDARFAAIGIAQQHNCKLVTLDNEQETAFRSLMPAGAWELPHERLLSTEAASSFMPFLASELDTGGEALFYGVNKLTRNPLMGDRKMLANPNGLILGIPGGGKSYTAKSEIVATLLGTDDDVIVCDPEGEYSALTKACNGQIIRIAANSPHHINPMDINLDYSDDDNPLALKSDFIISLLEVIMGGRYGLEAAEKTVIDRCLPKIYTRYLEDPRPENMPTLGDLYNTLRAEPEIEAARIATALEIYVTGSLNVFNNRTNVELDSRIICFDIKNLGKQLKRVGMLIVQDQVWNRVTVNRALKKHTRYYVDEFHLLLKDEQTAAYMVEIWKRFRKWGGIPTGITQNIKDLLKSSEIENILDNSDFICLLAQAPGDRAIVADLLGASEQQMEHVTNINPGEGLIFFGDTIVPFENRFDQESKLHALLTTKLEEAVA